MANLSLQAATELNRAKKNADNQRKTELARAYSQLGGSNAALTMNYGANNPVPTASIPTLEKAVVSQYEQAQNSGGIQNITNNMKPDSLLNLTNLMNTIRGDYGNAVQENADLYNEIRNRRTERAIANTDTPEVFTMPTVMGMGNGVYGMPTVEQRGKGVSREDLQSLYDEQNKAKKNQRARDIAEAHPVIGSAMATISRPIESAEGVLQNLGEYATGRALSQTYNPSTEMREQVNEGIESNLGRLAYGGVNSISDMALAMLLAGGNPNLSSAIMGLEKANDVTNDANARGLTPNQILAEGALSGVSTALTERLPMGRFANGGHIAGSMFSEGVQEGAEDLVDTFFDELVTKLGGNYDKSTLRTEYNQYLEAGYTPEEAQKAVEDNYKKQLITDTALGAITGGLMGMGSNYVSGRNMITGKPRTTETKSDIPTVNAVEDIPENIPTVTEGRVNPTVQNSEQQNIPTVNETQTAQNNSIPGEIREYVEKRQTLKERQLEGLKAGTLTPEESLQISRSINAMDAYIAENYPEWIKYDDVFDVDKYNKLNSNQTAQPEVKQNVPSLDSVIQRAESAVNTYLNGFNSNVLGMEELGDLRNELLNLGNQNPEARQQINNLWQNVVSTIRGTQTTQNTNPVQDIKQTLQNRTDLREVKNLADQYIDKLNFFNDSDIAPEYIDRINKAVENVNNSTGEAQISAVNELRNLFAEVENAMQRETIGVSARENNRDAYEQMKNVTDGRVIHISPDTLKSMDMTVTQLNNKISTGTNRLRFKLDGGTPIDSAYQEMYGLANGLLPAPNTMGGESDYVNAIVNYMTDSKTGKNEQTDVRSWNDVPMSDTRTPEVIELQNKADALLKGIADGTIKTNEEIRKGWDDLVSLGTKLNRKSPALGDAAFNIISEAQKFYRDSLMDTDIREARTPQDINKALHKINLDFFGNGEEEVDTDYVNKAHTGSFKESDVYNNTGKNSGIMTDREIEQHEKDNDMLYESIDEKSSMDQAYKSLKERGKTPERNRLLETDNWSNSDVDEAFILWQIAVDEATAIDERGGDSSKAWNEAAKFFRKIKEIGSGKGQGLQAFAKWSRNNTAEGLLHHASTVIKTAKDGQRAAQNNWDSQVARLTKDAHEMDADFMKEFLTEAKKIEGLDLNSREARHVMANLGRMINTQMPPNLAEKITTLLMDNMLGNIRTLITRNAGGNVGFNLMEEFLRKPLSALIDSRLASARGTNRTISGLTREGWNAWKEGFKEGFKQEIYDFQNDIQSARSGENTLENATANNRDVFNNKLLAKYNKLVKTGLSIGDRPFYEATYKQSLVEYNKLYNEGKIRGLDGKPLPKEKFNELAELHAKLNALAAVYQDDSAMAEAFVGMKKAISKMSEGIVGSDILSQFSMPFVKTPANIIERSIEYSPLGLAKNIVQTLREVKSDKIDFNQERFATELSRNIIGSGLFAIGLMMANGGALTGAYSDDKDMKQAQKEAGMQEFALHTGIGDFDLSWIPVIGNNLVSAASAFDSYNRPDVEGGQALGNGITAGVRSQFDTSALQGLQRLVGGSGSGYNSDTDIVTNAKNTLLSGGTQFVPSLFRQAAAFIDPNQRQLSGPNENDYYLNSVLNAIPGLRQQLEPKIGRTGEELAQNPGQGTLGKFLTNFVSPANWTQGVDDPVRDEAMRLFESTGNNIAFQPSVTMKELKTEDHVPTAEEFTEYQRNAYTAMNQIAQQIIGSDYYASMTDGEKESTLDGIYKAVKAVEKANILGTDKSNLSGASKAYDEGGADGLVDYLLARSYLNQLGASNNPENRETVLGMLENGEMEQTLALSTELQQAGLQGNLNETYKYEHASQYIPSLTPTDFAQTFTAIDQQPQGTSGHGSISQGEILDYLNQNPSAYSDEDAMQLWNAYGTGSWVYIPVLNEDGTWHKKKV